MDAFQYKNGQLMCEGVSLDRLADEVGTPVYVYSKKTFLDHFHTIRTAFAALDPILCYSIKSCSNLHILRLLIEQGSGMDVVSGGELYRAQQAGADMAKVVFAGVGKTDAEIRQGIDAGIGWFNIESEPEFENIERLARAAGKTTQGALRVNPDIADPKTHQKTSTGGKETKFGVDIARARAFFHTYGKSPYCRLNAIHLHIGSPIYSPEPYVQALRRALDLIADLRGEGFTIDTLDLGGGFAADYETGRSPAYAEYAAAITPLLEGQNLKIILEPGRTISGNAGVLLSQVQYVKDGSGDKKFAILDAGFNHLIRPAMYDAFHFIWPTRVDAAHTPTCRAQNMTMDNLVPYDVVGPVCETGDIFARDRALPPVKRGDTVCIFTAGAYGMVMASNYNTFPLPAEVLVDGDRYTIIRQRQTYDDIIALEKVA